MANKVDFPTFCHELIILRGKNKGQISTWQPVQNSAPIRQRLVEKPLKTVLFHQNDYQWPKNQKVAWCGTFDQGCEKLQRYPPLAHVPLS